MKLEIGKTYAKENGVLATIAGVTTNYPDWVWSLQGDWYEQSTGYRVRYIVDSVTQGGRYEVDPYHGGLIREVI